MTKHFRKRNAQALYDMHYGPNMTPMVDVVMVILIFFMASTALLGPEWFLKTYLPTRGAAAAGQQPTRISVVLTTGAEKQTLADVGEAKGLTMDQLAARLAEEVKKVSPEMIVVPISAAADVAYEDVVKVHEVCTRLGIAKVGLE